MNNRESLWYLIRGLLNGSYDINTFCNEFTRIYDLEIDYRELDLLENETLRSLSELTARFSDDIEELAIPNMYVSEKEIRDMVENITKIL